MQVKGTDASGSSSAVKATVSQAELRAEAKAVQAEKAATKNERAYASQSMAQKKAEAAAPVSSKVSNIAYDKLIARTNNLAYASQSMAQKKAEAAAPVSSKISDIAADKADKAAERAYAAYEYKANSTLLGGTGTANAYSLEKAAIDKFNSLGLSDKISKYNAALARYDNGEITYDEIKALYDETKAVVDEYMPVYNAYQAVVKSGISGDYWTGADLDTTKTRLDDLKSTIDNAGMSVRKSAEAYTEAADALTKAAKALDTAATNFYSSRSEADKLIYEAKLEEYDAALAAAKSASAAYEEDKYLYGYLEEAYNAGSDTYNKRDLAAHPEKQWSQEIGTYDANGVYTLTATAEDLTKLITELDAKIAKSGGTGEQLTKKRDYFESVLTSTDALATAKVGDYSTWGDTIDPRIEAQAEAVRKAATALSNVQMVSGTEEQVQATEEYKTYTEATTELKRLQALKIKADNTEKWVEQYGDQRDDWLTNNWNWNEQYALYKRAVELGNDAQANMYLRRIGTGWGSIVATDEQRETIVAEATQRWNEERARYNINYVQEREEHGGDVVNTGLDGRSSIESYMDETLVETTKALQDTLRSYGEKANLTGEVSEAIWLETNNMFRDAFHGFTDFLVRSLDSTTNIDTSALKVVLADWSEKRDAAEVAMQSVTTGMSAEAAFAVQLVPSMLHMIPSLALAYVTGGASLVAGAAPAGAVGTTGVFNVVARALANMAKSPTFWTTFAQVTGSTYLDAVEDGADFRKAAAYGIVNGALNAMIEIGGGVEALAAELEQQTGRKLVNSVKELLKSSFEEGMEEVYQGLVERSLGAIMMLQDRQLFSANLDSSTLTEADCDAIISFYTGLQEFAGGFFASLGMTSLRIGGDVKEEITGAVKLKAAKEFNYINQQLPDDYRHPPITDKEAREISVLDLKRMQARVGAEVFLYAAENQKKNRNNAGTNKEENIHNAVQGNNTDAVVTTPVGQSLIDNGMKAETAVAVAPLIEKVLSGDPNEKLTSAEQRRLTSLRNDPVVQKVLSERSSMAGFSSKSNMTPRDFKSHLRTAQTAAVAAANNQQTISETLEQMKGRGGVFANRRVNKEVRAVEQERSQREKQAEAMRNMPIDTSGMATVDEVVAFVKQQSGRANAIGPAEFFASEVKTVLGEYAELSSVKYGSEDYGKLVEAYKESMRQIGLTTSEIEAILAAYNKSKGGAKDGKAEVPADKGTGEEVPGGSSEVAAGVEGRPGRGAGEDGSDGHVSAAESGAESVRADDRAPGGVPGGPGLNTSAQNGYDYQLTDSGAIDFKANKIKTGSSTQLNPNLTLFDDSLITDDPNVEGARRDLFYTQKFFNSLRGLFNEGQDHRLIYVESPDGGTIDTGGRIGGLYLGSGSKDILSMAALPRTPVHELFHLLTYLTSYRDSSGVTHSEIVDRILEKINADERLRGILEAYRKSEDGLKYKSRYFSTVKYKPTVIDEELLADAFAHDATNEASELTQLVAETTFEVLKEPSENRKSIEVDAEAYWSMLEEVDKADALATEEYNKAVAELREITTPKTVDEAIKAEAEQENTPVSVPQPEVIKPVEAKAEPEVTSNPYDEELAEAKEELTRAEQAYKEASDASLAATREMTAAYNERETEYRTLAREVFDKNRDPNSSLQEVLPLYDRLARLYADTGRIKARERVPSENNRMYNFAWHVLENMRFITESDEEAEAAYPGFRGYVSRGSDNDAYYAYDLPDGKTLILKIGVNTQVLGAVLDASGNVLWTTSDTYWVSRSFKTPVDLMSVVRENTPTGDTVSFVADWLAQIIDRGYTTAPDFISSEPRYVDHSRDKVDETRAALLDADRAKKEAEKRVNDLQAKKQSYEAEARTRAEETANTVTEPEPEAQPEEPTPEVKAEPKKSKFANRKAEPEVKAEEVKAEEPKTSKFANRKAEPKVKAEEVKPEEPKPVEVKAEPAAKPVEAKDEPAAKPEVKAEPAPAPKTSKFANRKAEPKTETKKAEAKTSAVKAEKKNYDPDKAEREFCMDTVGAPGVLFKDLYTSMKDDKDIESLRRLLVQTFQVFDKESNRPKNGVAPRIFFIEDTSAPEKFNRGRIVWKKRGDHDVRMEKGCSFINILKTDENGKVVRKTAKELEADACKAMFDQLNTILTPEETFGPTFGLEGLAESVHKIVTRALGRKNSDVTMKTLYDVLDYLYYDEAVQLGLLLPDAEYLVKNRANANEPENDTRTEADFEAEERTINYGRPGGVDTTSMTPAQKAKYEAGMIDAPKQDDLYGEHYDEERRSKDRERYRQWALTKFYRAVFAGESVTHDETSKRLGTTVMRCLEKAIIPDGNNHSLHKAAYEKYSGAAKAKAKAEGNAKAKAKAEADGITAEEAKVKYKIKTTPSTAYGQVWKANDEKSEEAEAIKETVRILEAQIAESSGEARKKWETLHRELDAARKAYDRATERRGMALTLAEQKAAEKELDETYEALENKRDEILSFPEIMRRVKSEQNIVTPFVSERTPETNKAINKIRLAMRSLGETVDDLRAQIAVKEKKLADLRQKIGKNRGLETAPGSRNASTEGEDIQWTREDEAARVKAEEKEVKAANEEMTSTLDKVRNRNRAAGKNQSVYDADDIDLLQETAEGKRGVAKRSDEDDDTEVETFRPDYQFKEDWEDTVDEESVEVSDEDAEQYGKDVQAANMLFDPDFGEKYEWQLENKLEGYKAEILAYVEERYKRAKARAGKLTDPDERTDALYKAEEEHREGQRTAEDQAKNMCWREAAKDYAGHNLDSDIVDTSVLIAEWNTLTQSIQRLREDIEDAILDARKDIDAIVKGVKQEDHRKVLAELVRRGFDGSNPDFTSFSTILENYNGALKAVDIYETGRPVHTALRGVYVDPVSGKTSIDQFDLLNDTDVVKLRESAGLFRNRASASTSAASTTAARCAAILTEAANRLDDTNSESGTEVVFKEEMDRLLNNYDATTAPAGFVPNKTVANPFVNRKAQRRMSPDVNNSPASSTSAEAPKIDIDEVLAANRVNPADPKKKLPRTKEELNKAIAKIRSTFIKLGEGVYDDVILIDKAVPRLQTKAKKLDSDIKMYRNAAGQAKDISMNGLVSPSGDVLACPLRDVLLWVEEDKVLKKGKLMEHRQADQEMYLLIEQSLDCLKASRRAKALVDQFELANPHLAAMSPEEIGALIAEGDPDAKRYVKLLTWYANSDKAHTAPIHHPTRTVKDKDDNDVLDAEGNPKLDVLTEEECEALLEQLNDRNDGLLAAKAAKLHAWWDLFMRNWYAGRFASEEDYNLFAYAYPHYCPTHRELDDHPEYVRVANSRLSTDSDGNIVLAGPRMYERHGSSKPILSVSDQFFGLVEAYVRGYRADDVRDNLNEEFMFDTSGKFAFLGHIDTKATDRALLLEDPALYANSLLSSETSVVKDTDTGKYRMYSYRNGNKVCSVLTEDGFREMANLFGIGKGESIVTQVARHITGISKTMITGANPNFAVRNLFGDLPSAHINSVAGYLGYRKYFLQAVKEMSESSANYATFKALGGDSLNMWSKRHSFAKNATKNKTASRHVTDVLGAPGEATETVTRFAEYLATIDLLDPSISTADARAIAMRNAAEITVDFSRSGTVLKALNAYVPYLNAGVQGFAKVFTQMIDEWGDGTFFVPSKNQKGLIKKKSSFVARVALTQILPELTMYITRLLAGREKDFEEVSDYIKDNYFLIPVPDKWSEAFEEAGWSSGTKWLRVRKNRDWSALLGNPLMRCLEWLSGYRQDDPKELLKSWLQISVGGNLLPDAPIPFALQIAIDVISNQNFAKSRITSAKFDDYTDEYLQYVYTDKTSWQAYFMAKLVAKLGWDSKPTSWDYAFKSYMGDFFYSMFTGLGWLELGNLKPELFCTTDELNGMDEAELRNGADVLGEALETLLKDPYVVNSMYSNSTVNQYYDMYNKLKSTVAYIGDQEGSEYDFVEKHIKAALENTRYGFAARIRQLATEAYSLKDGSEEKDAIRQQIVQAAHDALDFYNKCLSGEIGDPETWIKLKGESIDETTRDEVVRLSSAEGDLTELHNFLPDFGTVSNFTSTAGSGQVYRLGVNAKDSAEEKTRKEEAQGKYVELQEYYYNKYISDAINDVSYRTMTDTDKAALLQEQKSLASRAAKEAFEQYLTGYGFKAEDKSVASVLEQDQRAAFNAARINSPSSALTEAVTDGIMALFELSEEYSIIPSTKAPTTFTDQTDSSVKYKLTGLQQKYYSDLVANTYNEYYAKAMRSKTYAGATATEQAAILDAVGDEADKYIREQFQKYITNPNKAGATTTVTTVSESRIDYFSDYATTAILYSNSLTDAAYNELLRLSDYAEEYSFQPSTYIPKKYVDPNDKSKEYVLTAAEQERYKEIAAATYSEFIERLLSKGEYLYATEEMQAKMLQAARDSLSDTVKQRFLAELETRRSSTVRADTSEEKAIQKKVKSILGI